MPLLNEMYLLPADLIDRVGHGLPAPSSTRYQLYVNERGLPIVAEATTIIFRDTPAEVLEYIHGNCADVNYGLYLSPEGFHWHLRNVAERINHDHRVHYYVSQNGTEITPAELIGRAGGKWLHLLEETAPV